MYPTESSKAGEVPPAQYQALMERVDAAITMAGGGVGQHDKPPQVHLGPTLATQRSRLHKALAGEPNAWAAEIAAALPEQLRGRHVVVTGTLERRLLAIEGAVRWVFADLAGEPHASRSWPAWAIAGIESDSGGRLDVEPGWLATALLTPSAVRRLTRPRVLLAALYRREVFPLPRFSLSVSDLARSARATLSGRVDLIDMQLGATVDEILSAAAPTPVATPTATAPRAHDPGVDVLGLSATFGQHALLTAVLDAVFALPDPPLVLAGGSLTARNERLLLQRYPLLLIARGAGEPTIADTIAHWHGDLPREHIRGIGYAGRDRLPLTVTRLAEHPKGTPQSATTTAGTTAARRTAGVANREQTDYLPELDLLDATFAAGGVAQLETSRGCTSSCSFCPRGHKGSWAGADPAAFGAVLEHMSVVFDRHPSISRVLYLVDEEFIGGDDDAVSRARRVAETLHAARYRWETSCRVDQVAQPAADRAWHVERAQLWRYLLAHGLRRCLFGIESGVTTILERFHKETTAEQNATAIRLLSALGVPTRYTYITFDHLMTFDELVASYAFQGRRDLILTPLPHLPVEDIVDGVHDPAFVATYSTGESFHRGISYMLVSMECLLGAAYTRRVQAAGLAGATRPSMGRIDAAFADPRIGICSDLAQRWIDRHFTLDYTLKSLEKALEGAPRHIVRAARDVFKDAAYVLLNDMIVASRPVSPGHPPDGLRKRLVEVMEVRDAELRCRIADTVATVLPTLPPGPAGTLATVHDRWLATTGWALINDAVSCTA